MKRLGGEKQMSHKKLEVEKCHFCGEPITKMSGYDAESYNNHHISYEPEIIVSSHRGCHQKYHNEIWSLENELMIPTSLTIRKDQKQWIEKNYFKLSQFVRERLDEYIRRQKEMELKSSGMCTGTPDF